MTRTFQNIRLFPDLSARDNVRRGRSTCARRAALAARCSSCSRPPAPRSRPPREASLALLERVGLSDRAAEHARNLSYGEQRRVEIARALASAPRLLLLDEPTAGMNPVEVHAVADAHPRRWRARAARCSWSSTTCGW